MKINNDLVFEINGKVVSHDKVNEWEFKRMVAVHKVLKTMEGAKFSPNFDKWIKDKKIDAMRSDILKVKMQLGIDKMRSELKIRSNLADVISKFSNILTNKRKFSMTEIVIPNTNLTPEELLDRIIDIMMVNNDKHLEINLNTNPDHYVLQEVTDNIQEVLETTGGAPLPTHFFAHYNDEEKLQSSFDPKFDVQAPGTARLEDGTIIGGVRHQVGREKNGLRFRALVEFPAVLPNYMIKEHQLHLACEFGHWISAAIDDNNFKS